MREDQHEIQTPKKEQSQSHSHSNRKAKSVNATSKKQHKNIKKSLNSVFAPITEDDVVSDKISLTSEAVDADLLTIDIGKACLISDVVLKNRYSEVLGGNEDQSSESIESFSRFAMKRGNLVRLLLFSNKIRILLLSFVLGMLAVSAGLFVFSDVQGYDHGPPPT
ncbi:hypothetical protein Tco_1367323 [Tanacetum coccineum]